MWKDGLIRDLLCTISRKRVALSYMIRLCLPALSFYFQQSNQHHHWLNCSSKAINIITVQAKPSTSSFFKQSNQHHHFSSKAIKFQRDHFSSKAINIIFQASNQHHHCSSKAISIIIFQATSSLFFFFFFFLLISFQLFAGILSNIFKLGSIIIVLSKQYCDKPRNEPYFRHTINQATQGANYSTAKMLSSM